MATRRHLISAQLALNISCFNFIADRGSNFCYGCMYLSRREFKAIAVVAEWKEGLFRPGGWRLCKIIFKKGLLFCKNLPDWGFSHRHAVCKVTGEKWGGRCPECSRGHNEDDGSRAEPWAWKQKNLVVWSWLHSSWPLIFLLQKRNVNVAPEKVQRVQFRVL